MEEQQTEVLGDDTPESRVRQKLAVELRGQASMSVSDQMVCLQAEYIGRQYADIQKNDIGLPIGIWLPDAVVRAFPEGDEPPPENAWVPISYAEGFPAIGAVPFWERMPEEPTKYYEIFKTYLELNRTVGTRSLFELSKRLNGESPKLEVLQSLYIMYYWEPRARSFDLYEEAVRRRFRAIQAQDVETKHVDVARVLFEKCKAYFNDEKIKSMNPAEAISLMKLVVGLERISTGLPLNGVTKSEVKQTGTPSSMAQFIQQIVLEQGGAESGAAGESAIKDIMRSIMEDPEGAEILQRAILKGQNKNTKYGEEAHKRAMEHTGKLQEPIEGEFTEVQNEDEDEELKLAQQTADDIMNSAGGLH